ncbi:GFA family protein [uncultured Roseibium sp.]|uniref:GFA family protein n=1 Tax=uncultured Roseibium sp. TaxID=1936171 RepID=UPI003216C920
MTGQNSHSGGCQCGAMRFRVDGELGTASICHCRMCQKAFGAFYAPLVGLEKGSELTWTRGKPAYFQSSNHVRRGFCRDCGTPLTYEAPDGLGLAIGAFDHPEEIVPTVQYGLEGKLPYADRLPGLRGTRTEEDEIALPFLATLVSHQHPDEDTDTWPPEEQR